MRKLIVLGGVIALAITGGTAIAMAGNDGDKDAVPIASTGIKQENKEFVEGATTTSTQDAPTPTAKPAPSPQPRANVQATAPAPPPRAPEPKPIDRSALIASCEAAKQLHIESYPVYKDGARVNHESKLAAIHSDWASRGMANSGMAQAEKAAENERYQAELAMLESQYQQKLATYDCR